MGGKRWEPSELNLLEELVSEGFSIDTIAAALPGRTETSVLHKIQRLGLSEPDPVDAALAALPEHVRPAFERARNGVELTDKDALLLLETAVNLQAVYDRIDPVVTEAEITFETERPVAIVWASCAHIGSRWVFHDKLRERIDRVLALPNFYLASLGDGIEGFLPTFRDAEAVLTQLFAPKAQRALLAYFIRSLAERGKILCGSTSQHGSRWMRNTAGEDPVKDMYLALGVPFLDGKAILRLNVGEQRYTALVGHQLPGSSIYNPTHAQQRAARFDFPVGDIYVQGDKHRYALTELQLFPLAAQAGDVPEYSWLVQTGTAKEGPDKYSILWWSRGVFEWPVTVLYPDTHLVIGTRHWKVAAHLVDRGSAVC